MQNVKNHLKICDSCQRKTASKQKSFTFYLNQRFVTENLRRHNSYAIIRKKTLLNIRSKESFEMNEKQSFRQYRFRICNSFHL